MQAVRFYINNKQYNEAVSKLGSREAFYGFAKEAFLERLEQVKEKKKEVWYECPSCNLDYPHTVRAEIEANTGRLIPVCQRCGKALVRRVKK